MLGQVLCPLLLTDSWYCQFSSRQVHLKKLIKVRNNVSDSACFRVLSPLLRVIKQNFELLKTQLTVLISIKLKKKL